jgi:hypothetical protein
MVQINDHGAGSLKCPGVKCDEILDVEVYHSSSIHIGGFYLLRYCSVLFDI